MYDNEIIEELSSALIREYLNRNGLCETLNVFDSQVVRSDKSIRSRGELVKNLHIEKLIKKNKESSAPLMTILDVVIKYVIEKRIPKVNESTAVPSSQSTEVFVVDKKQAIKKRASQSEMALSGETKLHKTKAKTGDLEKKNTSERKGCQEIKKAK